MSNDRTKPTTVEKENTLLCMPDTEDSLPGKEEGKKAD